MEVHCYNTPSNSRDLDLHYCGYCECKQDFYCSPHTRPCHLIHYVIAGEGFYKFRDKTYPVKKGEVFVMFPGEIASYWTSAHHPWIFCWFAFNGRRASDMLKDSGLTPASPVKSLMAGHDIPGTVNRMIDILQSDEKVSSAKLIGLLYLLMADLQQPDICSERHTAGKSNASDYVEKALLYMEHNYFKNISVRDLVEFVGLDRTYFSRIFKKYTGLSPQQYLLEFRINTAKQLLASTDLNLPAICRCIGIQEAYYLSRAFKKKTGMSPSQYRNSIR